MNRAFSILLLFLSFDCTPIIYKETQGFITVRNTLNEEVEIFPEKTRSIGFRRDFNVNVNDLLQFSELESVEISYSKFEDLKGIDRIKKLTYLNLSGTSVKDLQSLSALIKVHSLILNDTLVENFESVQEMKSLTRLSIANTQVKSLSFVQYFPELRQLDIRDTLIDSLNGIETAKKLTSLLIGNTKIHSIANAAVLKHLTNLEIDNLRIPESEIVNLRTRLPFLKIVRRKK